VRFLWRQTVREEEQNEAGQNFDTKDRKQE
jgi:hypothetical protein